MRSATLLLAGAGLLVWLAGAALGRVQRPKGPGPPEPVGLAGAGERLLGRIIQRSLMSYLRSFEDTEVVPLGRGRYRVGGVVNYGIMEKAIRARWAAEFHHNGSEYEADYLEVAGGPVFDDRGE